MKRTKNMTYNETAEARELELYALNSYELYALYNSICNNLKRHARRGEYDREKAADAFYYFTCNASQAYKRDFGYSFSVGDRFTAAVNIRDGFELDNMEM